MIHIATRRPAHDTLSGPISRDTAILSRYPISRGTFFREVSTPPKWCDTPPPWYLVSHRHICAIPHFATYRAIIVRYPTKTNTKHFCDTIAASIARYEKYRYWASKTTRRSTWISCIVFFRKGTKSMWIGVLWADLRVAMLGENLQGLRSWAWPAKFCRTFGVLQNLSSTGLLLCVSFCRTFLQYPKSSAEFRGTFGNPGPSFQALQILFPHVDHPFGGADFAMAC